MFHPYNAHARKCGCKQKHVGILNTQTDPVCRPTVVRWVASRSVLLIEAWVGARVVAV